MGCGVSLTMMRYPETCQHAWQTAVVVAATVADLLTTKPICLNT